MKKLLYDYHKLVERDNSEISGLWQGLHILLLVLIAISSMTCVVFIGLLSSSFEQNCVLFPKDIIYKNQSDTLSNETVYSSTINRTLDIPVNFIKSQWQDQATCLFPFFNPVMSFIYAIVWITFFFMCMSISKAWRIVMPAFVFMACYSIFTIVITNTLDQGLQAFKVAFHNMTDHNNVEDARMIYSIDVYTMGSIISGWVFTALWLVSTALLVLRCFMVVDFQMIHVKVELIKTLSTSPSVASEDFSPNESPTFPIHSFSQPPPVLRSPKILKTPGDKPREKKFVNLMDPAPIQESEVDLVARNFNHPTVTNVDVENQNILRPVPFTTFTIEPEPEHNKDDSSHESSVSLSK